MKKNIGSFFLLLFLSIPTIVSAQVSNDSLEYRIRPDSARDGSLFLSVNNFNFLRNYEFYNKFQDGYTLFGTQLEPQLIYYSGPDLVVMAGVNLRKDFGTTGIDKVTPLFSIKYRKRSFTMIAGSLEANIHHHFVEPLFDVEKKITDPVEYGTQFIIDGRGFYIDAFVNWRRMIYKPSPVQEQILAGASAEFGIAGNEKVTFFMPLQATVFHQGGQIDIVSQPLQTVLNTAAGFRLSAKSTGFLKELGTANYVLTYRELSPTKQYPFTEGSALYLNATALTRIGSLTTSYWRGVKFNAVMGMPIYQSISQQINYPGYTAEKRELLFLRYAYQKKLTPNFLLDFRIEPVFDLGNNGKMDFYHSLFLVYRQEFGLVKRK